MKLLRYNLLISFNNLFKSCIHSIYMNITEIRILKQYIEALEQANGELERMYMQKNISGINQVKKFILEVQEKISQVVKK